MNRRARELVEKQESFENPAKKFKNNPNPLLENNQNITKKVQFIANDVNISKKVFKSKNYQRVATFRTKEDILIDTNTWKKVFKSRSVKRKRIYYVCHLDSENCQLAAYYLFEKGKKEVEFWVEIGSHNHKK